MPPSVPIERECACVFIRSRVSSVENGVPKNQPERHASQIYKNRKGKKLVHQKIFPKDPYLAKYAYFSITKATIEMMKVRSSSDAWTKPNFQP